MNTTENQIAIIERPSNRKWPYVVGGFVAGVASIIGAAYFFDDESSSSYYSESSCDTEESYEEEESTATNEASKLLSEDEVGAPCLHDNDTPEK